MQKLGTYREDGFEVGVELSWDINKYALDFLHIFNNVKEQSGLIRVWNDYGRNVYVVCDEETHEACKQYLEQFGKIVSDNPVEIIRVDTWTRNHVSYDLDKYYDLILDSNIDF